MQSAHQWKMLSTAILSGVKGTVNEIKKAIPGGDVVKHTGENCKFGGYVNEGEGEKALRETHLKQN